MLTVPPCTTQLTRAKSTVLASALDFCSDASCWCCGAARSASHGEQLVRGLSLLPVALCNPDLMRENELYNSRMRRRPVTPTDLLSCQAAEVTAGMTNFLFLLFTAHRPDFIGLTPLRLLQVSLTEREFYSS